MPNFVPAGHRIVTAYLRIRGAAKAIEFYKKVLGAIENHVMKGPDGKVVHADIQIGDSRVWLADEFPEWNCVGPQTLNGTTVTMAIYVPDCDAILALAAAEGGKVVMPAADQFWGDRQGKFVDPFGHEWMVQTHKEDMTLEEMDRRGAEFMKSFGADCK